MALVPLGWGKWNIEDFIVCSDFWLPAARFVVCHCRGMIPVRRTPSQSCQCNHASVASMQSLQYLYWSRRLGCTPIFKRLHEQMKMEACAFKVHVRVSLIPVQETSGSLSVRVTDQAHRIVTDAQDAFIAHPLIDVPCIGRRRHGCLFICS